MLSYRQLSLAREAPEMTLFLKIFWMTVLTAIVAGLITLSVIGIPAPKVNVNKQIPIDKIAK
jgi:hypothetical protein